MAQRNKNQKAQDACKKELNSFTTKHQADAQWFMVPVDYVQLQIPQYPDVIKFPMDFGTILKRLKRYDFKHFEEFASDVTLVFANAILFNPPDHAVNQAALRLKSKFQDTYFRLLQKREVKEWCYPNVPPFKGQNRSAMAAVQGTQCLKIIEQIIGMSEAEAFRDPVDWFQHDLAHYPREVGRMMDLGTVKKWLEWKEYSSPDEFGRDVRQVFKNAMRFNQEGSAFHQAARSCQVEFERLFDTIKFDDVDASSQANSVSRADATDLATLVNKLSSDQLHKFVEKVKVSFKSIVSQPAPDELELDFDSLDKEAYAALSAFINTLM